MDWLVGQSELPAVRVVSLTQLLSHQLLQGVHQERLVPRVHILHSLYVEWNGDTEQSHTWNGIETWDEIKNQGPVRRWTNDQSQSTEEWLWILRRNSDIRAEENGYKVQIQKLIDNL